MIKYFVVIISIILFMASANANTNNSDTNDQEEVKVTLTSMWKAIEDNNAELYASYIHPEYTCFGENDVYLVSGKDKEVTNMKIWLKSVENVHTDMHQPQVEIVGNIAWITYYWTDSGVDNGKNFSSRGKSTRIFIKENEKWLCIHAHFTAVP